MFWAGGSRVGHWPSSCRPEDRSQVLEREAFAYCHMGHAGELGKRADAERPGAGAPLTKISVAVMF